MGSKSDAIVKLIFIFFISLLSFSVGTFVGKKYSDNQYRLSELDPHRKEEKNPKDSADTKHGENIHEAGAHGEQDPHQASAGDSAKSQGTSHSESQNESHSEEASSHESSKSVDTMTDDEIAKLAEEFVDDEGSPSSPAPHKAASATGVKNEVHKTEGHRAEPTARAIASTTESKGSEPAPQAPAHSKPSTPSHHSEAAATTTPTESHAEPQAGQKAPPKITPGKFTVQVASYADKKEAQEAVSRFNKEGYAAFSISAEVKGKTWYRVGVGQFNSLSEAQAQQKELKSKKLTSSAIIQKISNQK